MLEPLRPWGIAECSEYLGVSKSHFAQYLRHAKGFPRPLDEYTYTANGKQHVSRPEWAGIDVMIWRLGQERITQYLRNSKPEQPVTQ